MSQANKLLEKLVNSFYSPLTPSQLFIESQHRLVKPVSCSAPEIDTFLLNTSQKAFSAFKKLPQNENFKKLIYVMLCMSSKSPTIEEELKTFLRQGALGIEVSYFNPSAISTLRDKINYAIYTISHTLYSHGLIYKQLKMEADRPASVTHKRFLDKTKSVLHDYEATVLSCELDFLSFYSKMYIIFKKIKKLGLINDIFKNRTHLLNFSQPAISFENIPVSINNPIVKGFEDVVFYIYNECTVSYCLTGFFEDPFNEFFIKNHVLDYGMVPSFISKKTAETIAYIGKYTAFLKSMSSLTIPSDILKIVMKIDLSKSSSAAYLNSALNNVNSNLKNEFFHKLKMVDLLKYIHSTFLFGRIDFIENLFVSLKASRKGGKKNISNILENCLNSTFPGSPFNSLMDIYISQEDKSLEIQPEGFSLYIKLSYPISLLIEENFAIKLVYLFKFLWKLKKIDHLSRRRGNLKYVLLSQKLMFYAFQETIGAFKIPELNTENFLFDEFKKSLEKWIDQIMAGLFMNTKGKKIEHLLFNMEKSLLAAGNGNILEETGIVKALGEFYEFSKDSLAGTSLFDLINFLQ